MKIAATVLSYSTLYAFRRSVLRSARLVALLAGTALGTVACSFAQDETIPPLNFEAEGGAPGATAAPPNAPPAPGAAPSGTNVAPGAAAAPDRRGSASQATTGDSQKQSADVAGVQLAPFFQVPQTLPDVVGEPLSLDRLLFGTYSPAERLRRLDAYWDLSGKYALVALCSRNRSYVEKCVGQLQQKYSGNLPADVKALALSALNSAKQAYDSARVDFTQAQYDFDAAFSTPAGRRAAMNRSLDAPSKTTRFFGTDVVVLYVPSAAPSTSFYQTRFEEISRQRRVSAEASRINVLIPLLYETLQSRASQAAAEKSLFETEFKSSSSPVSLFAAADRYLAAQKEAIVAAIKYNCAIAAYSCETVPGSLQGDRLLATLNQRPAAQTQAGSGGQTPRPAQTAPQYNDRYGYREIVLPGLDYFDSAREAFAASGYRRDAYASSYPYGGLILPGLTDAPEPRVEKTFAQSETTVPKPAVGGVLDEPVDQAAVAALLASARPVDSTPTVVTAGYLSDSELSKPAPVDQDAALEAAKKAAEEEAARKAAEEEAARKAAEEAARKAAEEEAARKAAEEEAARKAAEEEAARKAAEEEAARKAAEEEAARKAAEEEAARKAAEEEAARKAAEEAQKAAAAAALQEQVDALPTVITGYEQPTFPEYRPAPQQTVRPVGDGAYWRRFDAELESFFSSVMKGSIDDADEETSESADAFIVRGQQTYNGYAPAGSPNSATSYETAQRAAATAEAESAEQTKAYQRVQQVVEIYFAPAQPKTDERTGVSERGLSLVNALSNAPNAPNARFAVAKTYWLLQGAVATLRIENIALAKYADALRSNPNDQFVKTQALGAQARQIAAQTKVRELQIRLLRLTNVSPGYGYPVPTTAPFCGKKFDLGSPRTFNANMRRTVGLIPERLRIAQELSANLNAPEDMLRFDVNADPQTTVATLEKNRELILSYIQTVVDLNVAIAEYVAYFPARVSNEQFVKALSGKDL